jgi:hypothetical protein
VTVEHDPVWHGKVEADIRARGLAVKIDHRLIGAVGDQLDEPYDHPYAKVADEFADQSLDFAVVDGQMRKRCIERAIDKIKPGGRSRPWTGSRALDSGSDRIDLPALTLGNTRLDQRAVSASTCVCHWSRLAGVSARRQMAQSAGPVAPFPALTPSHRPVGSQVE